MYRNLLVPLDGSRFAEAALPMALSIAERSGATVRLALVHQPIVALFAGGDLPADPGLDARIHESGELYLADVQKRLAAVTSSPIVAAHLAGPVANALQEQAVVLRCELIVMATHGRGPLSRFWLGSVADKLIRHATAPMLLVHPEADKADLTLRPALRRLLVPLDGSALAEQILAPATELSKLMKSECVLVRVVEPIVLPEYTYRSVLAPDWDVGIQREAREAAQTYLQRVVERLRGQAVSAAIRVVADQPAAVGILEQAKTNAVDAIALETHGRGGVARFLLGSVADKVVRGAACAVLLHRPTEKS